ncbi:LOW QUALITY PROTEIN: UNC93-like protein MFSD11 [Tachypleus tridentatus]|uniref:LOW QUALITY PROTEIN: UNC93-like protein MFSD11 n=2 Tax=Tachypleus tridentatus TaxID=6853 RepID=UPI003FD6795F
MVKMIFDPKLYNVVILGFTFMFVFTAFQTGGMIQKVVLQSIHDEDTSYEGDGYISLAIIYAVFAISNWIAPPVISFIGPKYSMFVGGITYALFISNFLYPLTWGLYLASVLIGVGAALIWTGQGNFLTMNSDSETMSRNSGIFWAMLQCSLLFGNLFVYFQFQGQEHISYHSRMLLFGVLFGICCLGLIFILIMKGGGRQSVTSLEATSSSPMSPKEALVRSFHLLKTPDMILLSVATFYTGIELSFFSGVYGSCIGFTKRLGSDSQKYVGISGMLIGIGEIIGGASFGILGKKTNQYGRDPIVILGYIVHMISFYLIFINLPEDSPFEQTYAPSYISSNVYIALLCSFLIGFGDSCYNTQMYSILGSKYSDDSAPAFALFKFVQSIAAAATFFYSNVIKLQYQLLILVVFGTIGTLAFCRVEWDTFSVSHYNVETTDDGEEKN